MDVLEELKALCKELGEENLIPRIESFLTLNKEFESKKGEEFIEASMLGFAEGILTTLKIKYSDNEKVRNLLEKVSTQRKELDIKFRKLKPPIFEQ